MSTTSVLVLQDLGDLQEARKCFERALKIDEQVYGPDHPDVAIRVNNLGFGPSSSGRPTGSQEMLRESSKD